MNKGVHIMYQPITYWLISYLAFRVLIFKML